MVEIDIRSIMYGNWSALGNRGNYRMEPNTKNAQVESLVAEVAQIAGESKTEAVQERRDRLFLTRMGVGNERRLQMLLQNQLCS